jgi:hypothetical protein
MTPPHFSSAGYRFQYRGFTCELGRDMTLQGNGDDSPSLHLFRCWVWNPIYCGYHFMLARYSILALIVHPR